MNVTDEQAAQAVTTLLHYLGEDPTRNGLLNTPGRVARALKEMTQGYEQDPKEILKTTFEVTFDEMVVLKGVRFQSLCEHHLLPFTGVAHVGYIPGVRVVGLSKMARLVQCFAKRLQVQERLANQVAQALMEHLDAKGVGVVIEAKHSCMAHRGATQPDAEMITAVMLGVLRENSKARTEFLRHIGR